MNDLTGKFVKSDPLIELQSAWLASVLELQEVAKNNGLTLAFSGDNSMQIRRISPNGKVNKIVMGSVPPTGGYTNSMHYD
ncbi:MAG: hypothetical protein GW778_04785 [Alphaproteobacteria bacterium]|nr:hypothetical protein [Alphaproteobacteria bacterium]